MRPKQLLLMALVFLLSIATISVHAQTFSVLYTFTGGSDGGVPYAGLVLDGAGNLYGTTTQGGLGLLGCPAGCGVVFKVDSSGNETVLHNFGQVVTDGAVPEFGSLLRDNTGNLYGTTVLGGAKASGTIFRLSPSGKETVVPFPGTTAGFPYGALVLDTAGNGYGTTYYRGTGCPPYGCGTVYKVNGTGKITVLHSFTSGADGANTWAGVVRDNAGNLYGTTINGGTSGFETVYKVDSTGKETVLHTFTEAGDGGHPYAGLILDTAGNLYGTTFAGGTFGGGAIFKIDSSGNETVLYSFCAQSSCADGLSPFAALTRDTAGNLYGTTFLGGFFSNGVVFKLDTTDHLTVLHSFNGASDGGLPYAGLVVDQAGNLYGTTPGSAGFGFGTVYKITP